MIIGKVDTDGIKTKLREAEFGYDKQGSDRGRVYIGTPYGNVALAKLGEVYTRTQIQESLPAIGLDITNTIAPTRVGQFK